MIILIRSFNYFYTVLYRVTDKNTALIRKKGHREKEEGEEEEDKNREGRFLQS